MKNNKANSATVAVRHQAMFFADDRTSGRTTYNTAIGLRALRGSSTAANNTGRYNTSVGYQALMENTNGNNNTASGVEALSSNTSGDDNSAFGESALNSNKGNSGSVAMGYHAMLYADDRTSGRTTYNTAIGYEALRGSTTAANNTGQYNTSVGYRSLYSNTTGNHNVANGYNVLTANTSGYYNTASGYSALAGNITGNFNTASGHFALSGNTNGDGNTAFGNSALYNNSSNSGSVAVGCKAMLFSDNRTAGRITYNTAIGYESQRGSSTPSNNTGRYNTSVGYQSLSLNTTGDYNIAIGSTTLLSSSGDANIAIGTSALKYTNGSYNIALGYNAGIGLTSGNRNILIGYDISNPVSNSSSNRMSIGNIIFANGIDGTGTVISSGNVGIGISNPAYRLHVVSNSSNATMALRQNGDGSILKAYDEDNDEVWNVTKGSMWFYNGDHHHTLAFHSYDNTPSSAGSIVLYNAAGTSATIVLDGDYDGDGRITTQELRITGGSDLSEFFELTDVDNIEKGMVVSIDENNPGHLTVSNTAYDKKVAGIISGAKDIKPGLIMSQQGTIADGEHLIALSGRVYCMVDATENPVEIGDMLTTSEVPGHAMKVNDFDQARGAIIGKAMTSLKTGRGLVLVLVSLQ